MDLLSQHDASRLDKSEQTALQRFLSRCTADVGSSLQFVAQCIRPVSLALNETRQGLTRDGTALTVGCSQIVTRGYKGAVDTVTIGCIQPVTRSYKTLTTEGCVEPARQAWQQHRRASMSKEVVSRAILRATKTAADQDAILSLKRAGLGVVV